MHYILFYDYVSDYLEKREPLRAAHFAHAKPFLDRGELFLAGAFANPADGAALVFDCNGPNVAERFAENDPYVVNGIVTAWRVREWTTVAGRNAAVKPPEFQEG